MTPFLDVCDQMWLWCRRREKRAVGRVIVRSFLTRTCVLSAVGTFQELRISPNVGVACSNYYVSCLCGWHLFVGRCWSAVECCSAFLRAWHWRAELTPAVASARWQMGIQSLCWMGRMLGKFTHCFISSVSVRLSACVYLVLRGLVLWDPYLSKELCCLEVTGFKPLSLQTGEICVIHTLLIKAH